VLVPPHIRRRQHDDRTPIDPHPLLAVLPYQRIAVSLDDQMSPGPGDVLL
jgi:hypothetical protein